MSEINNPWKGFASYEESDKDLFFGRDNAINDLFQLIDNELITTLYGRSGVGKSSLLKAGVIPKLKDVGYNPIYINVRNYVLTPSKKLTDFIFDEIIKGLEKIGITPQLYIKEIDSHNSDGLWKLMHDPSFKSIEYNYPIIVFDQFEEIFLDKEISEESKLIVKQLACLLDPVGFIDNYTTREEYSIKNNFRIVMSLREDNLYLLEDAIDKEGYLTLKSNRFRLRPLSESKAERVILGAGNQMIKDGSDEVVKALINASKENDSNISSLLLSQFCYMAFEKAKSKNFSSPTIDQSCIPTSPENADKWLYDYYKNITTKKQRKIIEKKLLTDDGHRKIAEISSFSSLSSQNKSINLILKNIKGNKYEIIHDRLAKVIFDNHEQEYKNKFSVFTRITIIASLCLLFFLLFPTMWSAITPPSTDIYYCSQKKLSEIKNIQNHRFSIKHLIIDDSVKADTSFNNLIKEDLIKITFEKDYAIKFPWDLSYFNNLDEIILNDSIRDLGFAITLPNRRMKIKLGKSCSENTLVDFYRLKDLNIDFDISKENKLLKLDTLYINGRSLEIVKSAYGLTNNILYMENSPYLTYEDSLVYYENMNVGDSLKYDFFKGNNANETNKPIVFHQRPNNVLDHLHETGELLIDSSAIDYRLIKLPYKKIIFNSDSLHFDCSIIDHQSVEEIVFPKILKLSYSVLSNLYSLKKVVLPDSIIYDDKETLMRFFTFCPNLRLDNIKYNKNKHYKVNNGILYYDSIPFFFNDCQKDMNIIISSSKELIIWKGITYILEKKDRYHYSYNFIAGNIPSHLKQLSEHDGYYSTKSPTNFLIVIPNGKRDTVDINIASERADVLFVPTHNDSHFNIHLISDIKLQYPSKYDNNNFTYYVPLGTTQKFINMDVEIKEDSLINSIKLSLQLMLTNLLSFMKVWWLSLLIMLYFAFVYWIFYYSKFKQSKNSNKHKKAIYFGFLASIFNLICYFIFYWLLFWFIERFFVDKSFPMIISNIVAITLSMFITLLFMYPTSWKKPLYNFKK